MPWEDLPAGGVINHFEIFEAGEAGVAGGGDAIAGDAGRKGRGLEMHFGRGVMKAGEGASGMIPGGDEDGVGDLLLAEEAVSGIKISKSVSMTQSCTINLALAVSSSANKSLNSVSFNSCIASSNIL